MLDQRQHIAAGGTGMAVVDLLLAVDVEAWPLVIMAESLSCDVPATLYYLQAWVELLIHLYDVCSGLQIFFVELLTPLIPSASG